VNVGLPVKYDGDSGTMRTRLRRGRESSPSCIGGAATKSGLEVWA